MERTDVQDEAGSPTRVCKDCKLEKPFDTRNWFAQRPTPGKPMAPLGNVCASCAKKRRRETERRAKAARVAARALGVASLDSTEPVPPAKGKGVVSVSGDRLPGELPLRQLAVAEALRAGAAVLNRNAQQLLDRVVLYANTPESAHHEWALKLLVERILPAKLYTEIGAQAAGIKRGADAPRPTVHITIGKTDGPGPAVTLTQSEEDQSGLPDDLL